MLKFSDGISINTSGEYRKLHLSDGWYVTGHGMLIPCADQQEAERLLEELQQKESQKGETDNG